MKLRLFFLVLAFSFLFTGCSKRSGDKQATSTAVSFWTAFLHGDKDTVAQHVRKETDLSFFPSSNSNDLKIHIGELTKDEDYIDLETKFVSKEEQQNESDSNKTMSVHTFMIKEKGKWKVDYDRTMESFFDAAVKFGEESGLPIEASINISAGDSTKAPQFEIDSDTNQESVSQVNEAAPVQQIKVSGMLQFQGKKLVLKAGILESWSPQEKDIDLDLLPYLLDQDELKQYQSNPVFVAWNKKSPDEAQWADWSPFIDLSINFADNSIEYTKESIELLSINIQWWNQRNESQSLNYRGDRLLKDFKSFSFNDIDPPSIDFDLDLVDPRWPDDGIKFTIKVATLKTKGRSIEAGNIGSSNDKSQSTQKEQSKFNLHQARRKLMMKKYKLDIDKVTTGANTIKQVKEILNEQALQDISKEFSSGRREEVFNEAQRKFPLYKKGDQVSVQTRLRSYSGMLHHISSQKIKVGSNYILLQDLLYPDPVCFNEATCQKRRDHFIRVNYDIPREDKIQQRMKELKKTTYRDYGFLLIDKKWVHYTKIIDDKIDPEIYKR